jgi:hypothetical protein
MWPLIAWGADIHIELFPMDRHTPEEAGEAAERPTGRDVIAEDELFHSDDAMQGADGADAVQPHQDWQGAHTSSDSGYYPGVGDEEGSVDSGSS